MAKSAVRIIAFLVLICLVPVLTLGAERPLSKDDVTLLLIGGASTEKMLSLIQQRGVDFPMNPDLAKKFHDYGAADQVIDALQKAGANLKAAPEKAPITAPPTNPTTPVPASISPPGAGEASSTASSAGSAAGSSISNPESQGKAGASVSEKIQEVMQELESKRDDSPENYPRAPEFSLKDISGQKLNLFDYKGKVVILDFWATWCAPCRSQIPQFVELQNQYRDRGFAIIGIVLDDRLKAVKSFYRQYAMNYPVAMGDRELRAMYGGIPALPTTLLIGRDGRIHYKVTGAIDVANFEWRVQKLLEGRDTTPLDASSPAPTTMAASSTAPSSPAAPAPPVPSRPSAGGAAPDGGTASNPAPSRGATVDLSNPSPERIQQITREFAAKEKLFKEARNNYAYHQVNKVQQLDVDGNVVGTFHQEWDILYDDSGKRIERVTYAPPDTLKGLLVTKEDLDGMRNIQPFVLTTDELSEYDVKYLGHVKVDEITAYVFSIRPREIKKGRLYFQGVAWVDDRDLQIVKSEGKTVPELKTKKGENLFPRFTTYREQIDGKFWFPTYTIADDTLYFAYGPIRIKQIIRYADYKQFKSKVRILSATPVDASAGPANPSVPPRP